MMDKSKKFGQELIMNLYDCNPNTLRSKKKILEYSNKICRLIKVRRFGKPVAIRFGNDFTKGFSLVQLIETSLVSGHFSEEWNAAYINVFSCKPFDHKAAEKFTKGFFDAKKIKTKLVIR